MPIFPVPGSFDYQPRTRVVFGPGSLARLGELARALPARRVLLVTDPGIVAAGHAKRAVDALRAAGVAVAVFDRVHENPTTRDVDACVAAARGCEADAFVGLGGGSSIDTARGANFLLTNGGEMRDYRGSGKATREMLPLIAVPTTAGTGSECQSYALIADPETHEKMACGDPKAAARIALLDPELTLSQPPRVTACTGIDALAHAIESAVTTSRSALSLLFSREAFRLIASSLERVLLEPDDLGARAAMQLGAALAGTAIENSMLGAAHSAANPLTARFGTTHGEAVGAMLPHVIRYNAGDPVAAATYRELAELAGLSAPGEADDRAAEALAAFVERCSGAAGLAAPEASLVVAALPELARQAAEQWTARYNPRPIDAAAFGDLYRVAAGLRDAARRAGGDGPGSTGD